MDYLWINVKYNLNFIISFEREEVYSFPPGYLMIHSNNSFWQSLCNARTQRSVFLASLGWTTPALIAANPFPQTPIIRGLFH